MRLANPGALQLLILVPCLLLLLRWAYGRNVRFLSLFRDPSDVRMTYAVYASLLTVMSVCLIGIAAQPQLTLRASGVGIAVGGALVGGALVGGGVAPMGGRPGKGGCPGGIGISCGDSVPDDDGPSSLSGGSPWLPAGSALSDACAGGSSSPTTDRRSCSTCRPSEASTFTHDLVASLFA